MFMDEDQFSKKKSKHNTVIWCILHVCKNKMKSVVFKGGGKGVVVVKCPFSAVVRVPVSSRMCSYIVDWLALFALFIRTFFITLQSEYISVKVWWRTVASMGDCAPVIEGQVKFREGKKWKQRYASVTRLSPVAGKKWTFFPLYTHSYISIFMHTVFYNMLWQSFYTF